MKQIDLKALLNFKQTNAEHVLLYFNGMMSCVSHRLQGSAWNIEALLGYIDHRDKS